MVKMKGTVDNFYALILILSEMQTPKDPPAAVRRQVSHMGRRNAGTLPWHVVN